MHDRQESIREQTAKCIRCGYCLANCPTYAVSGVEHSVARGRNYLAQAIIDEEFDFSKEAKQSIFECLLCGACIEYCAPAIHTSDIMTFMRSKFIEDKGQPALQRYLFQEILPHPDRMTRLMKLVALGKRSGLSGLAKALRVFGWFGKNIADMEGLVKSFPEKFLREMLADFSTHPSKNSLKIGYFIGCGINYAFPNVGLATLGLLKKGGHRVSILDNVCCGLPATGYGDFTSAREMARKNIQILNNADCDIYVSDCASCTSFLRDYPRLFSEMDDWREPAESMSRKILDMTEFLYRHPVTGGRKEKARKTVTYHDPCHLNRYLGVTAEPRNLLKNVESLTFIELPEANWCCGGAGTYNISHYDTSMKILKRKMDNVKSTGAQVLATACPGCLVQLTHGVRMNGLSVEVKHINQILLDELNE